MFTATDESLLPQFHQGSSALLISVPHAGTALPAGLNQRLSSEASQLPDTDWFVDRLYHFARALGASMLIAKTARLVVDQNRPSDDQPLYDASQTKLMTGVLPMQCFSGAAAYVPGQEPDAEETSERLERYWHPYHQKLTDCLHHIRQQHGHAIVLDAHSIRTEVPLLFDGVLPDLNLGSNNGMSAAPALLARADEILRNGSYSVVVDGRFKGGYITRHYGQPDRAIHALQLEIVQSAYMNEQPPSWDAVKAAALQQHLQQLVKLLTSWKPGSD
jgi:N-formylglutamate amidohydrolase